MRRSRRGFMMLDMTMGFVVITLLIALMVSSIAHHRRAARRQADRRTATRLAEQMAIGMQQGLALPAETDNVDIDVERDHAGTLADGQTWVLVTTSYRDSTVKIHAVVPTAAMKKYDADMGAVKGEQP